MHITLMRHGKPVAFRTAWLAPRDMGSWIAQYNQCVVEPHAIPARSIAAATSATVVVTSTAPRALSSVEALGRVPCVTGAVFLEAGLPFAPWSSPRLPAALWAAFFRALWMLGFSRGAESFADARARARAGARLLVSMAADGPVLLVGHGMMNHLIRKELLSLGWVAHGRQDSGHWGLGTYSTGMVE